MTPRQQQVLQFVIDYRCENGYSPTLAEIGKSLGGVSKPTVFDHLLQLERKGLVTMKAHRSRSVIPTKQMSLREAVGLVLRTIDLGEQTKAKLLAAVEVQS